MELEYIVYFIDEGGDPEEWAASSTSYKEALHYLQVYSQDGSVGLFTQEGPKYVTVDGEAVCILKDT